MIDLVEEFHNTYGVPVRKTPTPLADISEEEKELRISLIKEEVKEFIEAVRNDDTVEAFDALLDILWVTYGSVLQFGFPYEAGVAEVARSNRTKLGDDGKPIYLPNGKVAKGPNFSPPDLEKILDEHSYTQL